MDKLKHCPFCGGTDFVFFEIPSKDGSVIWHNLVHFPENPCSMSMMGGDKDELIQKWNTRADDQRTVKLLEALEGIRDIKHRTHQSEIEWAKIVAAKAIEDFKKGEPND
jgi:hypothetical protein